MSCAQMRVEDAVIGQTAGLPGNGALTFTGHAVRIYARSHFVLLAQDGESADVSSAWPAGNLVCARRRTCGKHAHPQHERGGDGGFPTHPTPSPPWELH